MMPLPYQQGGAAAVSPLFSFAQVRKETAELDTPLRRSHWAKIANTSAQRALRWRSQFTPEPASRFQRFHRIAKRDHALMNIIAGRTFECPNVEAGRAGRDPRQANYVGFAGCVVFGW
jgi:hypothetical protein